MRLGTVSAAALLLWPLGAAAQIGPVGSEFQVNAYTMNYQHNPALATDADGAFVVAWESGGQDGDSLGIFAQRYDSAGQAVSTEFQVNSYTTGDQQYPKVAAGADGAFVVAWESDGQDGSILGVFGQRYDSAGQVVGTEFQVNTYTLSQQFRTAVAAGADGAFVVTWESFRTSGEGVFAQRYDNAGDAVGTEFLVNTYTTGGQRFPTVAAKADGAFVVTWESGGQDGSSDGVFGQRYDSVGQVVGTEFQVNSYTTGDQFRPAVAVAADGAFVVAWGSPQDGGSGFNGSLGVFGQRYDSAGQAVGTEFQVNSYTTNYQSFPALAAGADGAFMVAWNSFGGQDGSSVGVFGQRYDSVGQAAGTEFQVNSYTASVQRFPSMAPGAAGGFVVVWYSNDAQDGNGAGVFGQRFGILATPTSTSTITPTSTSTATLVPSATPTPTPSVATCPATPSGTCAISLKAQLQLKLNASDPKDKLKWRFVGGPLLTQSDFGNPTTTASYALCIYDDGVLAAALQVGPSGTLWSAVGSKGYKYTDPTGASAGVTKMKLLGGAADKSKLQVKGKGTNLPLPTPVSGTRFFAQTIAVTAQLREVNGDCYATTFTDADTKKNDGTQYKAKK